MKAIKVLLLGLLTAWPAFAGMVFEVETTYQDGSPTYETELSVEEKNIKMGIAPRAPGSKHGEMIYRGDRREMVVADHENQTYTVIDEAALKGLAGQASQVTSQIEEALKNVPEDRREMVEQMMKTRMPKQPLHRVRAELRETGEKATHGGYPCVKYDVVRRGVKERELWVTDWANVEGGDEVVAAFEDMSDFFRQLLDSIPQMGAQQDFGEPIWEFMQEIDGFPVVTREFDFDGSLESETALRSARRRTLDPKAFEPPSRYKRGQMFPGD